LSEKRRLVSNTLANGAAQFTALASALVFMPLLIKSFGANDYGLYVLASAVASYASIVDLGVGTALVKNVAEHSARDDAEGLSRYTSTALAFYMTVGVLVAVVMATVAFNTQHVFNVTAGGAQLLRNLLLLVGLSSLWTWPAATAGYVLAGKQRYVLMARTAIGVAFANIGVMIAVLVTHQGPLALMIGNTAVGLVGLSVNALFAARELRGTRVSLRIADFSVFRRIMSFSWAVFVIQVSTVIVFQQTDRVVLGIFLGATAVTLYEAAGKMQGLVTQLTNFAGSAVMPLAAQLDAEGRDSALQTLFLRGTKYVAAMINPIVLGLMVLSPVLIPKWLGPAFSNMAVSAQVLLSYQLLTACLVIGEGIIVGQGKLKKRIPNVVFVVTLGNLVLSLLLVRRLGVLGVVIGTTLPYLVDYPFRLRFLLRELRVSFGHWLRAVVLPTYPALLVTAGAAFLGLATPLRQSLLGIALILAVSVGLYWIVVLIFGTDDVEKAEIRVLYARARAGIARRVGGSDAG
jgi:O-antigen/teichoic acid export membrane protein